MDLFPTLLWVNGKLFGIEWHFWKIVGWLGNLIFFSRFFVQWVASERSKRVVVPAAFWYLSLAGSLCLLAYGLYRRDSVFIFAYFFTWIPYIRNIIIARRTKIVIVACPACQVPSPSSACFCSACGSRLRALPTPPVTVPRPQPVA